MTLPLDELIARLKELDRMATPEPWIWYNGCSWWRLGVSEGKDTAIICPVIDDDGHPNMDVKKENREFISQLRTLLPEIIKRLEEKGAKP